MLLVINKAAWQQFEQVKLAKAEFSKPYISIQPKEKRMSRGTRLALPYKNGNI